MNILSPEGLFTRDLPTGNLVWVDQVNGNDSLAVRGQRGVPFKTLTAAKNAAKPAVFQSGELTESGDTIVVLPGIYHDQNLAKAGVNWHFMNGAKVEGVSTDDWQNPDDSALFDVQENARMVISGEGEFDSGDCKTVLAVTEGGADVTFRGRRLVASTWGVRVTADSEVHVAVDYLASNEGSCLDVRDGVVHVEARELVALTVAGIALYFQSAGEAHVKASKIRGNQAGIYCVGGVNVEVEAFECEAPGSPVVVTSENGVDGIVTIRNTRLVAPSDDQYPAVEILQGFTTTPPKVRLWNCFLKTYGGADSVINRGSSKAFVGLYGKCTATNSYDDAKVGLVGGIWEEANLD